jgi:hypothetical protein
MFIVRTIKSRDELYNSVMKTAYLSMYLATWFFSFNSRNFKKHRHGCRMELKFKIHILKFYPIHKWALRTIYSGTERLHL